MGAFRALRTVPVSAEVSLGHALGCEGFSQFPPTYRARRVGQTLDYVWAIRGDRDRSPQRRWYIVAAVECEGLDVPDHNLVQDVDKLSAITEGRRFPTAVVLYRTCEDGSLFWRPGRDPQTKQRELFDSANGRLRALCEQRRCAVIPAITDFELVGDRTATLQLLMDDVRSAQREVGSAPASVI
jgi:hypothetical protein